jgi:predicted hotdog family 3-hydroxylacyl-ACP dehydratase
MQPADFNVLDLIPQRPPMQMIDRLIYADEHIARGTLTVRESNLFCINGNLSESALIEFIAQTAAAYTGYKSKLTSGKVEEGYIGAVKNLNVYALPPVGSEIGSEIEVVNEIVGFTIITGKIFLHNKLIFDCEMRILGR